MPKSFEKIYKDSPSEVTYFSYSKLGRNKF